MNNRYLGTNPALTGGQDLLGRQDAVQTLDDHIRNRRSVVVMGVEGVGKSSLLNCYFNVKYRKQMALEHHILIRVTDFPTDRDTDGIYQYLAEGVLRAVDSLDQEETEDVYKRIRERCVETMGECQDAASRFQQVCEVIQDYEYFIVLVIDGFERFVSSPNVKMEHHNLMNTLISKNLSFVVATNYDFNQDSLPKSVSGSFLLMKFSGNEIRLKGPSEQCCAQLTAPGDFTEAELHQLWILSGGVPSIFRKAAQHTFEQKEAGEIVWKEVLMRTYADVSSLLAHWCKLLSEDQVQVLKTLSESDSVVGLSFEEDTLRTAAQALVNRGILANPIEAGTLRTIPGLYKFNSPLLKLYCKEHDLQVETISVLDQDGSDEIEDNQLVKEYGNFAGKSAPSLNEDISDALLGQYQLTRENYSKFGLTVQRFIRTGIIVDQTLLSVELFDHSPQFIEFAKACEEHLNLTLLPVLQAIDPGYVMKKGGASGQDVTLKDTDHLMLGQFVSILNSNYRYVPFTEKAGQFCNDRMALNLFPTNWWDKLRRDMSEVGTLSTQRESVADIRNGIAHVEFVAAKRGEGLLRTMFFGDKSLFNRCQTVYEEAVNRGIVTPKI